LNAQRVLGRNGGNGARPEYAELLKRLEVGLYAGSAAGIGAGNRHRFE
jgi:hypothetical protein